MGHGVAQVIAQAGYQVVAVGMKIASKSFPSTPL